MDGVGVVVVIYRDIARLGIEMDRGDIDVSHGYIVGEEGEERDGLVVFEVRLVVEDDARERICCHLRRSNLAEVKY